LQLISESVTELKKIIGRLCMKRMKGRLLTALMSLAMVFTMMPLMTGTAYAASITVDGIKYNYDESTSTASVASRNGAVGEVTIPSMITVAGNNYTVTAIENSAFDSCGSLTGVEIPSTVTTIGTCAFQFCSNLDNVTIPNSVTSIGSYAFGQCSSLTNITIPSSVTIIEGWAFNGCSSLTGIEIPNSVTSIGNSIFWGCNNLKSITIPPSVTSIGDFVFTECSSLDDVYVKSGQWLGNYPFLYTLQNINIWYYSVNTPGAESGDDKTHVTITSLKDKSLNDIAVATPPISLSGNAMGDGYAIDAVQCCATGNATDGWNVYGLHDWKEATCIEPKTCEQCGTTEGTPLGHKYSAWTKLNSTQHQKVCQHDKSHVVKENHKWDAGKVTKKASEKQAGVKTYTCTVCKATRTETIPKLKAKVSGTLIGKTSTKGKTALTIGWIKTEGADGYDIFFAECNHSSKKIVCKNVKTIKGNKTFTWTKSGLKKGTAYKAYVKAYVMKNGKKSYVRTSPMMHAYTGGQTKNYTNAKSVTVNKTKVSLKKGKTFKIKAKVKKLNKNKKLMPKSHAPTLRYLTSNNKVATVSKSGKITAKGKGSCVIYVFAHNGLSKQVKVTVN
jgi:hypothetical protein